MVSGVASVVSSAVTYDMPLQSFKRIKEGTRRVFVPEQTAVDMRQETCFQILFWYPKDLRGYAMRSALLLGYSKINQTMF